MMMQLSLTEIIAFTAIMMTLLSGWVALRVKIQRLETTSNLKFLEIENRIKEANDQRDAWVRDMKEMIRSFLDENKEEHRQLIHSVNSMRSILELLKLKIAKNEAVEEYKLNKNGKGEIKQ